MPLTLNRIVRDAADKIYAAYWEACDAAHTALDPSELTDETWAADLLAEAYDIALRCEADPLGWEEGRAKW